MHVVIFFCKVFGLKCKWLPQGILRMQKVSHLTMLSPKIYKIYKFLTSGWKQTTIISLCTCIKLCFFFKSEKHDTNTLNLVQNRVRLKKTCKKVRQVVKVKNAPLFVPNWVSSSFDPVFPFSWSPALLLHIFSLFLHVQLL